MLNLEKDFIPMTKLRSSLGEVVEEIVTKHSHKVIIRNGEPAVVVMGVAEYQQMQDQNQLLRDRLLAVELQDGLMLAKQEEKRGELIELDDLAASFGFDPSEFEIGAASKISERVSA